MEKIRRLEGRIRHYDWGSRHRLAALQGRASPTPEPEAELWFGAHPLAPALVETDAGPVPLDEWIARDPERSLGRPALQRFGARLPFLVKLLAVESPLSIQVHPDAELARAGFERQSHAGIPLDAPARSYSDPHAKPELVCALERLSVLHGFRPLGEVVAHLAAAGFADLLPHFPELERRPTPGLWRTVFGELLAIAPERRRGAIASAADRSREAGCDPTAAEWVSRLARGFPEDVGALAPLLLRLVVLEPGEALFVPSGLLHCYLEGFALEVMASSDNVLRGGLTSKHVDRAELLRAMRFEPEVLGSSQPWAASRSESRHPIHTEEFAHSVLELGAGASFEREVARGVEILVCVAGTVRVAGARGNDAVALAPGEAAWVPAAARAYGVTGTGSVHRVRVPSSDECEST